MRENVIQSNTVGSDGRTYIQDDWYPGGLPVNIKLADNIYIDSSYGFESIHSLQKDGLSLDEAMGCYGEVNFLISPYGKVAVGKFTVLNSTTLICNNSITIGNHCMLAWGSVITDSWAPTAGITVQTRGQLLIKSSSAPDRPFPFTSESKPVVIEDNCWVGFDAVIMPGVTLGRGSVISCKTVVDFNVPPYAVVGGSPAKIIKYLEMDDTEEARIHAFNEYLQG